MTNAANDTTTPPNADTNADTPVEGPVEGPVKTERELAEEAKHPLIGPGQPAASARRYGYAGTSEPVRCVCQSCASGPSTHHGADHKVNWLATRAGTAGCIHSTLYASTQPTRPPKRKGPTGLSPRKKRSLLHLAGR